MRLGGGTPPGPLPSSKAKHYHDFQNHKKEYSSFDEYSFVAEGRFELSTPRV